MTSLQHLNEEFATLWSRHEIGLRWSEAKRFIHTESHDKLALLNVLGTDIFTAT